MDSIDQLKYEILSQKIFKDPSLEGKLWKWVANPLAAYGGDAWEQAPMLAPFRPTQAQIDALGEDNLLAALEMSEGMSAYAPHMPLDEGKQMSLEAAFKKEARAWYCAENERFYRELLAQFGEPEMTYDAVMAAMDVPLSYEEEVEDCLREAVEVLGAENIAREMMRQIQDAQCPFRHDEHWDVAANMAVNYHTMEPIFPLGLSQETIDEFNKLVEEITPIYEANKRQKEAERQERQRREREEIERKYSKTLPTGKPKPKLVKKGRR